MICNLSELLQEFQEAVARKEYVKIPYSDWRDLKERAKVWETVFVDRSYVDTNVKMSHYSSLHGETICFEYNYPFGKFLWNKLKEEYDADIKTAVNAMKDSFNSFAETAKTATANLAVNTYSIKDAYDYWNTTSTLELTSNSLRVDNKTIKELIEETIRNNTENRKENDNMTNLFKNFDFGSCENDNVKMSMYGIAVKNPTGTWVSYDSKSGNVIDVDILNFNGKYLYKMPSAIKDIKAGDVIIHNRKPVFVTHVEDGKILCVDPAAGEEKVVLPTRNMFGFDFVTRVVNLFGDVTKGVSADSPFGNMLPIMMLADEKNNDMLPLFFMMNGGKMDATNPLMMYFLMKDGTKSDLLPLLLLTNGNVFNMNRDCGDCDCESAN